MATKTKPDPNDQLDTFVQWVTDLEDEADSGGNSDWGADVDSDDFVLDSPTMTILMLRGAVVKAGLDLDCFEFTHWTNAEGDEGVEVFRHAEPQSGDDDDDDTPITDE